VSFIEGLLQIINQCHKLNGTQRSAHHQEYVSYWEFRVRGHTTILMEQTLSCFYLTPATIFFVLRGTLVLISKMRRLDTLHTPTVGRYPLPISLACVLVLHISVQ